MKTARISLLFLFHIFHAQAYAQTTAGVVRGQILSTQGFPVAGVRVAAMEAQDLTETQDATSLLAGMAQTDDSGRYRLEDLPPGRYYIVAGKLDRSTYFPGVNTAARANTVRVAEGSTVTGVDFWISEPLNVTGRIFGSNPASVDSANVLQLFSANAGGSAVGTSPIAANGAFEFLDVPPGVYRIQPRIRQEFAVAVPHDSSLENQPGLIRVDDRSVTGVVVSFAEPLLGRIVMDHPGPVPPFTIRFVDSENHAFSAMGSSDRPFSIALFAGDYRVSIQDLPAGYSPQSILYGGKDILRSSFSIKTDVSEMTVNLAVSDPPPWARVHGRVTLPPGESSPMAFAFWAASAPWRRIDVRPDGTFDMALLPGEYRVQMEGYFPDFLLKSFSDGKVDLTTGTLNVAWRDVIDVTAVIERVPPVRISGRVRGIDNVDNGDRSRPVTVELLRLGRIQRFEQPVGTDGSFEFKDLPPGFYRIGVPEELAVARTFIVDADHDVSGFDVTIPPQVRIAGSVVLENGGPLPDVSSMAIMAMGPHATAGGSVRPDGTFSFSSTEGEQQIAARSIPPGYAVKSVTSGTIDLEKESIQPTGSIEIRVTLTKR